MGFWDFIAPDYDSFVELVSPWVPDAVVLGPVVLARDTLVNLAYLSPASGAGIATRLFYQAGNVQAKDQATAQSLLQAILDNLARGGVNPLGPTSVGSDLTEGLSVTTIVVPNTYEVTIRMTSGGRAVDNVFHFTGTGSGQEVACATAVQTAWKAASRPWVFFDNKVSLVNFEAVDLSSLSGGIYIIPDTSAGTRTVASIATRAACALIQYNGGTRNRSARGRTYFGPIYEPDVDIDGATLTGAYQTSILASFNAFFAAMVTAGFTQCVLSRKLVSTTPVTSRRVSATIATQRRRLRV